LHGIEDINPYQEVVAHSNHGMRGGILLRLIVAILAYNEEQSIENAIRSVRENAPKDVESLILVVDDGSTDGTLKIARHAGADIISSHCVNSGLGLAYKTAIAHAVSNGADIICTIDADRQFYSEQRDVLLEPIRNGSADLVVGS